MQPVACFQVDDGVIRESYPDGKDIITSFSDTSDFTARFNAFTASFFQESTESDVPANGLFGYTTYDAVRYFEKITLKDNKASGNKIPDLRYHLYRYIIAINHFQNTLRIIENQINGEAGDINRIETIINSRNLALYTFHAGADEESNVTDNGFREMVRHGKEHCHAGDVFQVVMSRRFSRDFTGDEFNVYRALRSVNPSPYLFYFDYGSYRIFGSSPEAHLKIQKGKASINPIAGTFRRTGDDENDKLLAQQLVNDTKENSEHVMLVDLARNDLSRYARNVRVESFREVQFYSHVIHLVSAVSGDLREGAGTADMMAATFPAGTLSGAPKYMAMKIIDKYEADCRGYYGGALGFIDFNGGLNHAIMIRTFLSRANKLYYQAGAGVVAASDEEKELQEVNNKLGALRKAIVMAEKINR